MNKDILHNDIGDLHFENGDFKIGVSDQQHIGDLFIAQPGENKEYPLCGFGAIRYIKRIITESEFKRDLKLQLEYDGYLNTTIDTSNGIESIRIEV